MAHGGQNNKQDKPFGAIGATAGVLGAMQALEVLKYLLGLPVRNDGLAVFDGLAMRVERCRLRWRSDSTLHLTI